MLEVYIGTYQINPVLGRFQVDFNKSRVGSGRKVKIQSVPILVLISERRNKG